MENYKVLELIGKGNFGSIHKILRISDNKVLVWKELDYGKMTEKEKHNIVSEVNILRELRHPNIVRYYDRIIDKKNTKIYIIMEYCSGGDIGKLIKTLKNKKEYFSEEIIWKIFIQLILALYECHNHKEGKILHRDIKPSNVFLDSEKNVKLGDFGLSRMLSNESNFAYSHVGTPYYMSPEQIEEMKYDDKSDIWSLGCFLYELVSLNPPFDAANQLSLALKIKAGKVNPLPKQFSFELNNVIMWMLSVNMNNRPSIDDLINYPPVHVRIRERKLKDYYLKIKKLEDNVKEREKSLIEKEKSLSEKENENKIMEQKILKEKENIKDMERMLEEREKKLEEREKIIEEKEKEIEMRMENINTNLKGINNIIIESNNQNYQNTKNNNLKD